MKGLKYTLRHQNKSRLLILSGDTTQHGQVDTRSKKPKDQPPLSFFHPPCPPLHFSFHLFSPPALTWPILVAQSEQFVNFFLPGLSP